MTMDEIRRAVEALPADELSRFRAWFAEYDGATWDEQIERDAAEGRLDALADEALRDFREGRTLPL
jgi:hypothetical protein